MDELIHSATFSAVLPFFTRLAARISEDEKAQVLGGQPRLGGLLALHNARARFLLAHSPWSPVQYLLHTLAESPSLLVDRGLEICPRLA